MDAMGALTELSAQKKIEAMLQLNKSAREAKKAWLQHCHPDWSEREINQAVRDVFLFAKD